MDRTIERKIIAVVLMIVLCIITIFALPVTTNASISGTESGATDIMKTRTEYKTTVKL